MFSGSHPTFSIVSYLYLVNTKYCEVHTELARIASVNTLTTHSLKTHVTLITDEASYEVGYPLNKPPVIGETVNGSYMLTFTYIHCGCIERTLTFVNGMLISERKGFSNLNE